MRNLNRRGGPKFVQHRDLRPAVFSSPTRSFDEIAYGRTVTVARHSPARATGEPALSAQPPKRDSL